MENEEDVKNVEAVIPDNDENIEEKVEAGEVVENEESVGTEANAENLPPEVKVIYKKDR